MDIRFNSLQTGRCIQRAPILSPVGPWLRNTKTKRELRTAFFLSKFSPKIPQTHVCIDPNAIFFSKRLRSQVTPVFLDNFCRVGTQLADRVCCFCKVYAKSGKMSNFFQRAPLRFETHRL